MKWIIMQEMEEAHTAMPFLIMDDDEKAYDKADELTNTNPGFIFWVCSCEEEGD